MQLGTQSWENIFWKPDLNLESAIQAWKSTKEIQRQAKILASQNDEVTTIHNGCQTKFGANKFKGIHLERGSKKPAKTQNFIELCKYCNRNHNRNSSLAFHKICSKCNFKKTHFAQMYRSQKSVHKIQASSDVYYHKEYSMNIISINKDHIGFRQLKR